MFFQRKARARLWKKNVKEITNGDGLIPRSFEEIKVAA
jgi:hypothetical protein